MSLSQCCEAVECGSFDYNSHDVVELNSCTVECFVHNSHVVVQFYTRVSTVNDSNTSSRIGKTRNEMN